jgi:hypothetical protein
VLLQAHPTPGERELDQNVRQAGVGGGMKNLAATQRNEPIVLRA